MHSGPKFLKGCGFWVLLLGTVSAQSIDRLVTLEEFVVEATKVNPHPWRYIAVPGYEILSQCDVDQTEAVARHVANSLELDRRLLPLGSWGNLTTPLTLILFDFKPAHSIAPFVPKALESKNGSGRFGKVILPGKELLPNDLVAWNLIVVFPPGEEKEGGIDTGDFDTHCVVQNRWNSPWNWSGGTSERGPIPLGRLFRLNSAVPPMPTWFEYSLVGPCSLFRMKNVRDPFSLEFRGGVVVSAATWLTDEDTASLVNNYKRNDKLPVLPPIGDLFYSVHLTKRSSLTVWPSSEYMAEAALFVRWGMTPVADEGTAETMLFDRWRSAPVAEENKKRKSVQPLSSKEAHRLNEAHQKAFARFLDRSRTGPVTESVFRECFGFGYAEMQSILSEYLVTAAQKTFLINRHAIQGWSPDDPVPSIREATADEIGRIIGDWLRMQADSFPETQPSKRDAYLWAAGQVLENAFREDNGLLPSIRVLPPKDNPRALSADASLDSDAAEKPVTISPNKIKDPRLLAVYGLYYFDIGDAISARIFLEAAIQAQIARPAAYVALARLNFATASAKPAGDQDKFSAAQVAAILSPLFTVIKNWKLDVEGYLLVADTWSHSSARPKLANLQALKDGLYRYPFDSSLLRSAAELYAQWGYRDEANEVVERSLRFAESATAEKLRTEQSTWAKK